MSPTPPNVLSLIGKTPLVPVHRLNPYPSVCIEAKLEKLNPGGSVKDRVALAMVEAAERSGQLTPGKTLIEATSGNTGIGLAMVCAVKGYTLRLLMPESASEERRRILRAYGAQIQLTPGHLGTDGAIEEAYRMAREEPEFYVLMDQFNNPASIAAHYETTAPEIWEQTAGEVTHVVVALGTSGTAMGLSQRLKEYNPAVEVVGVEPYAGHKIQGLKNMQESYPPGIYERNQLDRIVRVDDEQAFGLCRALAQKEGIFAGLSSGAALAGALTLAAEIPSGRIVIIFPDGGERYLSTPVFDPPAKQGMRLLDLQSGEKRHIFVQKNALGVFTPGPGPEELEQPELWRRLVWADILVRYLRHKDFEVHGVVGLADWDEHLSHLAEQQGCNLQEMRGAMLDRAEALLRRLGLETGWHCQAASQCRETQLALCRELVRKGLGYEKLRSVYYDVGRDTDYGVLRRTDLAKLSLGKTVDLDRYAKDNPRDFTLLKRTNLADLKRGDFWKTEWGNVRPSWYLQMAAAALAEGIAMDVVLAGRAHHFPHMENLRALWAVRNALPQVWLMTQAVEGEAIVPDIETASERLGGMHALRLWLLSGGYRKPLHSSEDNATMWRRNWERLQESVATLHVARGEGGQVDPGFEQTLYDVKTMFWDQLEDDLDLQHFWPVLWSLCRTILKKASQGRLAPVEAARGWKLVTDLDTILGVVDWHTLPLRQDQWPEGVRDRIALREQARRDRDFARADLLRQEIVAKGYRLEDTPQGPRVFPA
ncbi:cysteine synthase [Desulfohalobium retbaense]|uniref:cysteine synthase n=1 Tax=Desulfohalobium retbaense (strain ATCC 49708 / DSM 5692 / JCM 16813 / HR100) TaxID=485915 RepID=C8X124_DESRD|nr:cysteine synthase [Desulfohalobium retbaense]ACV68121.1 cysteine synthase [Desulfohalobium retbaense DSM 5692]